MESMFTEEGLAVIVERIEALNADCRPKWGKMTVEQMLAHCQIPLEIALGDDWVKTPFYSHLIGPFLKLYYTSKYTKPPKNLRTLRLFRIYEKEDLDFLTEQTRLLLFLRRFSDKGKDGKLVDRHPRFGPMSQNDWDLCEQKHLDHHLRQFGV
ncbi:MAG: DUF1569 domain-containing protein [Bacteroidetes bacterium]|nr:DUF1569 domain-containing protein [Bacteroidota bacterium]